MVILQAALRARHCQGSATPTGADNLLRWAFPPSSHEKQTISAAGVLLASLVLQAHSAMKKPLTNPFCRSCQRTMWPKKTQVYISEGKSSFVHQIVLSYPGVLEITLKLSIATLA